MALGPPDEPATTALVACVPNAEATNVAEEFMTGTLVVVATPDAATVGVVETAAVDLVAVKVDRCVSEVDVEYAAGLSVDEAAIGASALE